MARPVVVIADKLSQSTVDALGDSVEVRWVDGTNREELLAAVPEASALLVRSATKVDREVLEAAPKLSLVGRAGVGLDNVDVDSATEFGIMVANAPTSNIRSACEQAIALTLATARNTAAADKSVKAGEWRRSDFVGVELYEKTIGIVGLGHIGQLFAQRLRAFEVGEIIAYDPYANPARARQLGIELTDLDDLVSRSDFITIHLPKTAETTGMFDAELLAKSKPGQIIVNAARGGLIDEEALAEAIESGRIRGAGVDVYESEPPKDSPLLRLGERVTLTPHLGASTKEAQDRAGSDVAASVLKALNGEYVPEAVNVPGGNVSEEVSGWLDLTRKLGLAATRLLGDVPVALQVTARGELSSEDVSGLGSSALRGLLADISRVPVTFVNAEMIAKERGVRVSVDTSPESTTHRSTVEVAAIAGNGDSYHIEGAITGLNRVEKIVRLEGRGIDLRAEGVNLFISYRDQAGMLGRVATLIGDHGINIENAALAKDRRGGDKAILVVQLSEPAGDELLERLRDRLQASALQIDLD